MDTIFCSLCGETSVPVDGVDGWECAECGATYIPPDLYPDLAELAK